MQRKTQGNWLRALALLAFIACGSVQAAGVYDVSGPNPFGFVNQHVMYMSWSQSSTYTGVSVSVPLADFSAKGPIGGTEGTMYLVNQIGPGTTSANNVAPPMDISGLSATFTTRQLWTGLTLPPGTYYLVFASASNNPMSMSPEGSSTPVLTPGTGVTPAPAGSLSGSVDAFAPASSFVENEGGGPGNLFLTITGTPAVTPPSAQTVSAPTLGQGAMAILALTLLATGVGWRRGRSAIGA